MDEVEPAVVYRAGCCDVEISIAVLLFASSHNMQVCLRVPARAPDRAE